MIQGTRSVGRGPAAGSGVIDRRLLQHDTLASRRALLRGLACSASALALGGCVGVSAGGVRFDASSLSSRSDLGRRNHAQAGERRLAPSPWFGPERARDDGRTGEAQAAERQPFLARRRRDLTIGVLMRSSRCREKSAIFSLRPAASSDVLIYVHGFKTHVRDGGARCRAALRRHQIPRPDDGVLLAVQGGLLRLRL